jgi:hypothetical protein
MTPHGNPWLAGRVAKSGSSLGRNAREFFLKGFGGGVEFGLDSSVFGLELFHLELGGLGVVTPLGATAVDIGDALLETFVIEFEFGVFVFPEVATAAEEPGLNLLGGRVSGLGVDWPRVAGSFHEPFPKNVDLASGVQAQQKRSSASRQIRSNS